MSPLEDGRYPEMTQDSKNPDYLFTHYHGELSPPEPMLERIGNNIYDPINGAKVPFEVETQNESESSNRH